MEGWVDLGYPAMHRPGTELAISWSLVRRPTTNRATQDLVQVASFNQTSWTVMYKWLMLTNTTHRHTHIHFCSTSTYVWSYSRLGQFPGIVSVQGFTLFTDKKSRTFPWLCRTPMINFPAPFPSPRMLKYKEKPFSLLLTPVLPPLPFS